MLADIYSTVHFIYNIICRGLDTCHTPNPTDVVCCSVRLSVEKDTQTAGCCVAPSSGVWISPLSQTATAPTSTNPPHGVAAGRKRAGLDGTPLNGPRSV